MRLVDESYPASTREMKSKSVEGITRDPKELTFAWTRGDQALIRFWIALFLATVIFLAIWFSVRVKVPAAMAPDRMRVDPVQLIEVSKDSHPSLRNLLADKKLPSLGGDEGIADAPMLEGMLSLLGLEEESGRPLSPYPEPIIQPNLVWPKEEQDDFTLPPLPEIVASPRPQMAEQTDLEWEVSLKGQGKLGELLKEKILPWDGAVPAIRSLVWSVVVNEEGALAFAGALDSENAAVEQEIREKLQRLFESEFLGEGNLSGVVELKFEKKGG